MDDKGPVSPFPGSIAPHLFEYQLMSNNPTIIPPKEEIESEKRKKTAPKPETTKDNLQYK